MTVTKHTPETGPTNVGKAFCKDRLDLLFNPRTVAVAGVSRTNDRHPANIIFQKLLLRYPVRVFAVNPGGGRLQRERVYPDLAQVPEKVDHVVIAVKAEAVPAVLEKSIAAGAGGATIVSGGFAESGRGDLQEAVARLSRQAGFPVVGPNCLGIYAPDRFDTFFLPGERLVRPASGNVAFVSQSGGVLVDQMVKFAGQGIGLSLAVSIGNKAALREVDLLGYLAQQVQTEVIAFYIEGFAPGEGRAFVEAARRCRKPVVVLKAGKSPAGMRAVASHTASLAGNQAVFSQAMRQSGIAEAGNEYELISFCEALSCYRRTLSGKVGILTVSGGHGALAVDMCEQQGLSVPPLPEHLKSELARKLNPAVRLIAALGNPVDLTGSATDDDFIAAANTLSTCAAVDCLLVLLLPYSPGISSDLGARIGQVYREKNKPIVAYVPHVDKYRILIEGFELNRIPVSNSIEGAALMIKALKRRGT